MPTKFTVIRQLPWDQQPEDVRAYKNRRPLLETVVFVLNGAMLVSPEGIAYGPEDRVPLVGCTNAAALVADALIQRRTEPGSDHDAACVQFAGPDWQAVLMSTLKRS